jgi:hypothetical protein
VAEPTNDERWKLKPEERWEPSDETFISEANITLLSRIR